MKTNDTLDLGNAKTITTEELKTSKGKNPKEQQLDDSSLAFFFCSFSFSFSFHFIIFFSQNQWDYANLGKRLLSVTAATALIVAGVIVGVVAIHRSSRTTSSCC